MRLIDADALLSDIEKEVLDGDLFEDKETPYIYADGFYEGERNVYVMVEQAYTIDPVVYGEWIPCSEKLPDATVTYYLISTNRDAVDIGWWSGSNWESFSDAEVIAWTPLPEPYKEASDE